MKREVLVWMFLSLVWFAGVQAVLSGTTVTWSGGGGNNLASTAANWVDGVVPQDGDDVVLDATSSKDMIWDIEIKPGSWLQDGYGGIVTIGTKYGATGLTNLVIIGDCDLRSGVWTHITQPKSDVPQYRLKVVVGGDFTLGSGAQINVDGKGFPQAKGPGAPGLVQAAASHGGRGARTTHAAARSADCYGSIVMPADLGSGGREQFGTAGGGAVWLEVGGILQLDGGITANGATGSAHYSGSGGSIYCRAGAMQGGGAIMANAGSVTTSTPGGGGRIALVVTNAAADWSGLTGVIEAGGLNKSTASSSGTIYRETAADAPGNGELIIRGHGVVPYYGMGAQIGGQVAITSSFSRVTIENAGVLVIATNSMLDMAQGEVVCKPSAPAGGICLDSGALRAAPDFILTNIYLRVQGRESGLCAAGSFTVGINGELRLDQPLSYDGDFVVAAGGLVSHTVNDATGAYKAKLEVTGNMTIAAGGAIDVTGKGYPQAAGPGIIGAYQSGASHGGLGARTSNASARTPGCYGSITEPFDLGSGGISTFGNAGGGAVWLEVGGVLRIDGDIAANGAPGSAHYSGSGGSIYCRAGAIHGAGSIRANTGAVTTSTPGGGGRIALVVTNEAAGWEGLTATVEARGYSKSSASSSGTIYRETAADAPGRGELIIRGYGTLPMYGVGVQVGGQVAATSSFARVRIENNGMLVIDAGSLLDLTDSELACAPLTANGGLAIAGGTLAVAPGFVLTNSILWIQSVSASLDSGDSFIVGNNGELRLDHHFVHKGNLSVASGGLVSRALLDGVNPAPLSLAVTGDLTVAAGGSIDVSSKGFTYANGPGRGTGGIAASHGGRGASYAGAALSRPSYGSIVEPVTCGSGGGYNAPSTGGGALRLDVAGTLRNDGVIAANGEASNWYSSAGGSVWITAGALVGGGAIEANGGSVSGHTPGGGGRVAVTVTNAGATVAVYQGTFVARSGNGTGIGGAGTVYLRDAGQGIDEGTLVIDNNGRMTNERWAEVVPSVEGRNFGALILRNGGCLHLGENEIIQVSGVWSNGALGVVAEPGATVNLGGSAAVVAEVYGNNTFDSLVCDTPGKTIRFAAGSQTRIPSNGVFRMVGASGAPVDLVSGTPGTAWELILDEYARQDVRSVAVADSDAGGGAEVIAINSTDNGGTDNWRFLSVTAGTRIVWNGAANTLWGDRRNWDLDRVPMSDDVVEIPAGVSRYPVLAGAVELHRLEVTAEASLALAGFDITVTDSLAVAGRLVASAGERIVLRGDASFAAGSMDAASSTVVFEGSATQTFSCNGNALGNVFVRKTGGILQVLGGGSMVEWRTEAAPGSAVTIAFEAEKMVTTQRLLLTGDAANPNITLGSTVPGTPWSLRLSGYRSVIGVSVSDSDATTGLPIMADSSVDSGGNDNWLFGAVSVQWIGGVNNSFHTAGNWSSGLVPDADTRVVVASPAASLTISQATAVRDLTIGGGGVAVSVTANAPLVVGEALTLLDRGTLVLNKPSVVSNSVAILNGGLLTHAVNAAVEENKIDLMILGDIDIEAGGMIDVRTKGYAVNKGPGAPGKQGGGSHGGRGVYTALTTGPCYGSIIAPTSLGSGGYWYPGGGAIRLTVSGAMRHNGAILANASAKVAKYRTGENDHYTGAGGSIFITAGSLMGSGDIQANGGNYMGNYGGGGGRVALVLTGSGADFAQYSGAATAYGGRIDAIDGIMTTPQVPAAGAGTVYLQTAAEGDRRGTLVIDNDGGFGANYVTDLPADVLADPKELRRVNVEVRNGGTLRLIDNATIGDLHLLGANTRLNLNSNTLTIHTWRHSLAPGLVTNEGEIIWLSLDGSVIIIR